MRECLRARRRHIHALHLGKYIKPTPLTEEIISLAHDRQIPIKTVPRQTLDKLGRGHQGVAAEVGRLPKLTVTDLLAHSAKLAQPPFLLALDHLEDPQNVGALLRTADAVGIHGVIIPNRRSVNITPTVVKASAGASEHLFIAQVTNLAQTLQSLKKQDVWVVGIEQESSAQVLHQADLNMPLVLVLGNEGKGLTRLVKEICDLLIAIPMVGHIASLNVSVAGALALYEVLRSRR